MTITTTSTTSTVHPLAPLTSAEIVRLRTILTTAGLLTPSVRLAYIAVNEPPKSAVLDGTPTPRRAEALLIDIASAKTSDLIVDLDAGRVDDRVDHAIRVDGTGPLLDEEYLIGDAMCKEDPRWVAALARRGVTDLDEVRVVALSPGSFGYEDELDIRAARAVAYRMDHPTDLPWAHPIGGVVAHLDLTNRRVLRVIETDVTTVPEASGDYLDPSLRGPERTTLKPITITQPEGVSFTVEDGHLRWENWDLRVGFNGREGMTLHQVGWHQGDELRPIIYRASVAEMMVNYGDPSPIHNWQNYFDTGEYQFGRMANSLELGCDCVGEIRYLDAVVADDLGNPKILKNAICIHEEDYGILWKHNDVYTLTSETRRQRRLVVSFFVTVGNYDYGFYWYFYLDGKIELEAKATGIVFTSGHPGGDYPYAPEVAPGVGAPIHQHLFSARLDMMVDGLENSVDEIDFGMLPISAENPTGSGFGRSVTRLATEKNAVRDANPLAGRTWRISSSRSNRMGHSTGYVLHPEGKPTLLSSEGSSARARGAFATHHLWVTQADQDQRWPAGRLVNQHPGGAGLPSYIEGDRSVEGQDIVLWHTFGLTHHPRLEDYPIMPVDYTGFRLTPEGFFDRNPTLDVPAPTGHCAPAEHCAPSGQAHHCAPDHSGDHRPNP